MFGVPQRRTIFSMIAFTGIGDTHHRSTGRLSNASYLYGGSRRFSGVRCWCRIPTAGNTDKQQYTQ